jgi:hypothetical protein
VFAYILMLILLLPITFVSGVIENLFSPDELTEMGIRLERPDVEETC